MQCNIDARGRRVRFVSGVVTLGAAVVLAAFAVAGVIGVWWIWLIVAAMVAGGAFQIFEARKGWCAVRAMGMKTPI